MEENNKYDALVETIKIEDIATDKANQDILRRLKQNDETFVTLWICNRRGGLGIICGPAYLCYGAEELGWLGYFIGKSTCLREVGFYGSSDNDTKLFIGLSKNKSIRKICFISFLFTERVFERLDPFLKNHHSLADIDIQECIFDDEGAHQLSQVLGGCNSKSLKRIQLTENQIEEGQLLEIIQALNIHPQLEYLDMNYMHIGRNACTAVATLLSNSIKHLQTLKLYGNNVDNDGVEALVHGISGSKLQILYLSRNPSITNRGWKTLSTLLQMPDSNLERLNIAFNNIDDEVALIFANAMVGNSTLKTLDLRGNGFTTDVLTPFSKLLCDTSSINKTYLSNHTLESLGAALRMPAGVQLNLALNRSSESKGQIAIRKILRHHSHFNVKPFFEWEFKVLPLMIAWLEKARTRTTTFEEKLSRMKLSVIYDFVREFPMLYIEPVTRKEIEDCIALEQVQGDQSKLAELEEVQRRKERAMRRLF